MFLGLDLGKRRDYTALVAGFRRTVVKAWDPVQVRFPTAPRMEFILAERYPLGTRYTDIAKDLARRWRVAESRGWGVRCAVDATGVGEAVLEIMDAVGLKGRVWPVMITGGHGDTGSLPGRKGASYHSATKSQLFYMLRAGMEQGRTVIRKDMPGFEELMHELRCVEEIRTPNGYLTASGKGSGHDDLAFAAALAQWALLQSYPGDVRVPWL